MRNAASQAVAGKSSLNVANLLACIEPLSTSDANTEHLVNCGILEVVAKVLTQTAEDMADRHMMFQYNVVVSRAVGTLNALFDVFVQCILSAMCTLYPVDSFEFVSRQ